MRGNFEAALSRVTVARSASIKMSTEKYNVKRSVSVSYFAASIVLGDEISELDSLSLVVEQSPQLGMSF